MREAFSISRVVLALSCFGLLATVPVLSGCMGNNSNTQAQKPDDSLKMQVIQVDQVMRLGDKVPDGQYMIAKVEMQNASNKSITLTPADFVLENITTNDAERYSQPAEKFVTVPFTRTYGDTLKDKVMDYNPSNLYPRLQLDRYFVFMVPADAKPSQYQITYKPGKVSAPLASTDTVINDRRNASAP